MLAPVSDRRTAFLAMALLGITWAPSVMASTVEDFLKAADNGQCIESVVFKKIHSSDRKQTRSVVANALAALTQRAEQQRALGCDGDIAAQAIAAGADPGEVLDATAAGLKR